MFSVKFLTNGKPLSKSNYNWHEKTKTFSTNENNLVLDFSDYEGVTFKTGFSCTFHTGSSCTFDTRFHCTFNTGSNCIFKTGSLCTFHTGSHCIFHTDSRCTFHTDFRCTFDTDSRCTFVTGHDCTFVTGHDCTFKTGENCFVTRWEVNGCDKIPKGKKIKLNDYGIKGYTIVKEPNHACNGKVVEIEGKKYKLTEIA
jgi:hypothetical protein